MIALGSNLLWWIGGFVVAVGVLVTVHEFGHFWVARRLGFKVERFKIGFLKTLWSRRLGNGETEFAIGALPLGGYVKMLDEREGPVAPEDLPRSFTRRPVWQRVLVLLAGPVFNLVFAVILYTVISAVPTEMRRLVVGAVFADTPAARAGLKADDEFLTLNGKAVNESDFVLDLVGAFVDSNAVTVTVRTRERSERQLAIRVTDAEQRALTDGDPLMPLGFSFWLPDQHAVVGRVDPGAAQDAGIRAGDRILAVDGLSVRNIDDAREKITWRGGETVPVRIARAGETLEVPVAIARISEAGRTFGRMNFGFDGRPDALATSRFPPSMIVERRLGPVDALVAGVASTWKMSDLTVKVLWKMVTGKVSPRNLGGPVTIAKAAGESARAGLMPFLNILAFISVSLAILNLLPVPVLDGGQIVYQLAEAVRGRPLSERAQVIGQQIGLAMIAVLLSFVLVNDFTRNF